MKELVRYLLENMYVDFQGEISLDTVRQFLMGDDSREAKALQPDVLRSEAASGGDVHDEDGLAIEGRERAAVERGDRGVQQRHTTDATSHPHVDHVPGGWPRTLVPRTR